AFERQLGQGDARPLGGDAEAKGITVFARIDHAAGAAAVGMPVRPSGLLIFGDPTAGTGPMEPEQAIGGEPPPEVDRCGDADGGLWTSYDAPAWLAVRQGSTTARRTLSTPSAVLFPPSMAPLPLSARPRDWFFVVVFAAFALTSFLVDTLPALGWSTFMHD